MDKIFINSLTFEAVIGVYEWERRSTQKVVLDLELMVDNNVTANEATIADVLDYVKVAEMAQQIAVEGKFQLVETLAGAIAEKLVQAFSVPWIKIRVTKPDAVANAAGVGVEIVRDYRCAE